VPEWQSALDAFLALWRSRPEVTGALVCGSFVVGDPSPRSDIDVHILLREDAVWRQRGNQVVDG
jgi:predicted nucleotidyltransferase